MAKRKIKTDDASVSELQVEPTLCSTTSEDIPQNALDVLKVFTNYPELLITPHGRVFTADCKLAAAQGAILYKNPYYNL